MTKQSQEEKLGVVTQALPNTTFRVTLEDGQQILAHLSGKMRMYRISIMPGDKVKVETTPYDSTKGRITYRIRDPQPENNTTK